MNALTLGTTSIRQLDGLYSLNDLHAASGGDKNQQPANFLRLDQTQALIGEIQSSEMRSAHKTINGGKDRGTYVCRELVYAYANWISAAFYLKMIRAFDAPQAPAPVEAPKPPQALPAPAIDRDTQAQINRHAWQLAQGSFEQYRRQLETDLRLGFYRGPIDQWQPRECRDETLKTLACTATVLAHQVEALHDQGRALAALTGATYHERPSLYRPVTAPAGAGKGDFG